MSATVTTPELAARAAEAWAMLARADEPMPAFAAVDYVQDLTDDRGAAKQALYEAAARWLPSPPGPEEGIFFFDNLRRGNLDLADDDINGEPSKGRGHIGIRWFYRDSRNVGDWLAWCDVADRALTLCRAVEAA